MPYIRIINKPIRDNLQLYVDKVKVTAEVDTNQGLIKLPEPLEQDKILIADFTFDIAVRFASDNFEYSYSDDGSIKLSEIELLEVK